MVVQTSRTSSNKMTPAARNGGGLAFEPTMWPRMGLANEAVFQPPPANLSTHRAISYDQLPWPVRLSRRPRFSTRHRTSFKGDRHSRHRRRCLRGWPTSVADQTVARSPPTTARLQRASERKFVRQDALYAATSQRQDCTCSTIQYKAIVYTGHRRPRAARVFAPLTCFPTAGSSVYAKQSRQSRRRRSRRQRRRRHL